MTSVATPTNSESTQQNTSKPKNPARRKKLALALVFLVGSSIWLGWQSVQFFQNYDFRGSNEAASSFVYLQDNKLEDVFDMRNLQIPRDHILHGGPPKDGIPALTDPKVMPVSKADWPDDDARVVGVKLNGEARAYPVAILARHEIVNDTLGGMPIAVLYCPLCDSVSIVDRRLKDTTYEFGVSGLLYNSNVLMYDRTDDALWSQVDFQAISGPNAGQSLRHLAGWELAKFGKWRTNHSDATVLSKDTGYNRSYSGKAYASYFETDDLMFPVTHEDDRIAVNKSPVIGVSYKGVQRAYPLKTVREKTDNGVFVDRISGATVRLELNDDSLVRIVEVPENANVIHTYWFAWAAMHPETEIYGRE